MNIIMATISMRVIRMDIILMDTGVTTIMEERRIPSPKVVIREDILPKNQFVLVTPSLRAMGPLQVQGSLPITPNKGVLPPITLLLRHTGRLEPLQGEVMEAVEEERMEVLEEEHMEALEEEHMEVLEEDMEEEDTLRPILIDCDGERGDDNPSDCEAPECETKTNSF